MSVKVCFSVHALPQKRERGRTRREKERERERERERESVSGCTCRFHFSYIFSSLDRAWNSGQPPSPPGPPTGHAAAFKGAVTFITPLFSQSGLKCMHSNALAHLMTSRWGGDSECTAAHLLLKEKRNDKHRKGCSDELWMRSRSKQGRKISQKETLKKQWA